MKKRVGKLLNLGLFATVLSVGYATSAVAAEYSASFKNADINEFINIVGKNLNKTIVLDPTVRGSINVRSYDLLNEKQYYQFFLNVLEVYGFAIVEMENDIIKVIKAKDAKVSAIPVVDDGNQYKGDEMVTRVVPVTNVSVRQLAPLLRQLNDNAGGGNVVHYDPSNVIMITGRAAVVNRLVKIIARVDKAGDQEVDIVKLKFASALEMVKVINSIQKPATGGKNTTPSILMPRLVADERTNSLIISGEKKTRQRIIELVKKLDNELKNNGNTRVFYLKYAKAEEVVNVLKGVSKSLEKAEGKKAASASSRSELSIESHEGTNSVVVSAQPALMSSLSNIIRQLDIRRAQVLVEAIIVEVSEGDGINLSVQWASPVGGTQFQDNGVTTGEVLGAAYQVRNDEDDLSAVVNVISKVAGGVAGYVGDDWGVMLQAISTNSSSNILATPSITTLDNQEASFIVGDEVPVLTGATSSSSNDNPFQTIERKEVGIKLKVTPQINDGDAVQLVIEQEVSNIKGETSVDVIFATRSVKTSVLAKSGETIVIGGLIDEKVSESVSKVPLLGDIPWLGHLFKSTKSSTEKRNLMIFLRATIIRDDQTMSNLSTRKYGLMREIQLGRREDGIGLMPNTNAPVLPAWGESHEINPADFLPEKTRAKAQQELTEKEQSAVLDEGDK
ncbi:type II secretion system protein GspD [Psychromonas sp. psych-6C06]|uniref:type II secretion system secretin GspD n=1 Tax=Psychromonas sp. psych-6C06 TaxID=2058089 RepID=UPI000C32DE72|nr:type II secretion system secretin GspD [Psychromonas sp. psych-6C06]PKF61837.1 type II secretion system protein GspD [Psychromonas sp. psych-6C06]